MVRGAADRYHVAEMMFNHLRRPGQPLVTPEAVADLLLQWMTSPNALAGMSRSASEAAAADATACVVAALEEVAHANA